MHRVSGVGQDQPVFGGKEQVEEQLTIVASQVAIAAPPFMLQHVERRAPVAAREHAVIQPHHGNDAERQTAHRLERRHGHTAGQKRAAAAVGGQLRIDPVPHHGE